MSDPVPSKECDYLAKLQHSHPMVQLQREVEELRRDNRRWENAHKILLAEVERHKRDVKLLEIVGKEQEQRIAELKRPAHEREPPHCSSCACGMTPEPEAGRHINLPIATWAQALDIIGQCAEIDAMDDHATAWIREASNFVDVHAASLTASAQPPGVER